jgi:hypothetical protein
MPHRRAISGGFAARADNPLVRVTDIAPKFDVYWIAIDSDVLLDLEIEICSAQASPNWFDKLAKSQSLLIAYQEKRLKDCKALVLHCVRPLIIMDRKGVLEAALSFFSTKADSIGVDIIATWDKSDFARETLVPNWIPKEKTKVVSKVLTKYAKNKAWLTLELEANLAEEQRARVLEQASKLSADENRLAAIASADATRSSRKLVFWTIIFIFSTTIGSIGSSFAAWIAWKTFLKPEQPERIEVFLKRDLRDSQQSHVPPQSQNKKEQNAKAGAVEVKRNPSETRVRVHFPQAQVTCVAGRSWPGRRDAIVGLL